MKVYYSLLKLYLSGKSEISRKEFCYIIDISETDYTMFKRVFNLLEQNNIVKRHDNVYGYSIIFDIKKFERFFFSLEISKLLEKARKKRITKFGITWE